MSAQLNQDTKLIQMTRTPIPKLMVTLAIPPIISMLITSLYNMADTYFVGQIGATAATAHMVQMGTSATAAVGVALPLMTVIQAIGFTFGQGSGNTVSRLLGAQKREDAEKMISVGFFTAFLCGLLLGILGLLLLEPLVHLLGATESSAPLTKDYIRFILIGFPFMVCSVVLNCQFRYQGNTLFGTIGILFGAILNVILDPIFILVLGMGTGGAALATILSQFVGFLLLVGGTFSKRSIHLSLQKFRPNLEQYRIIAASGIPSFWRQSLASLATLLLNVAGRNCGGNAIVAAMSIVSRFMLFANSSISGFGQGYQPICGFNYGAGRYGRVREAFFCFLKIAVSISILFSALGILFAPQIIAVFRADDAQVIRVGTLALRMQCITFPALCWFMVTSMTLQTIGRSGKATLIAVCRQGLAFIPLILILPHFFGVLGIQLCQPLADYFSCLVALYMGFGILRELKQRST